MGQDQLNDGLREDRHKPGGGGTNPHGHQGSRTLRRFRKEFRHELDTVANEALRTSLAS